MSQTWLPNLPVARLHGASLLLPAACSAAGDCSARLAVFLGGCRRNCTVTLAPDGALFKLEHAGHLSARGMDGLTLDGRGTRRHSNRGMHSAHLPVPH